MRRAKRRWVRVRRPPLASAQHLVGVERSYFQRGSANSTTSAACLAIVASSALASSPHAEESSVRATLDRLRRCLGDRAWLTWQFRAMAYAHGAVARPGFERAPRMMDAKQRFLQQVVSDVVAGRKASQERPQARGEQAKQLGERSVFPRGVAVHGSIQGCVQVTTGAPGLEPPRKPSARRL